MLKHVTTQVALLIFVMCFHNAFAQPKTKNRKFGKLEDEYVKMKVYEKDSSATSLILFNYCDAKFEILGNEIKMFYNIHKRIKILSEADIDQYANLEIPYYGYRGYEKVMGLKAMVYNEEGGEITQTKIGKDQMFIEDLDGRRFVKKASFPNVKIGSVIEYTYTLSTNDFYAIRTFYFQSSSPTLYAEYRMNIPDGLTYSTVVLGEILPIKVDKGDFSNGSFKGLRNTYSIKDIPALKEEPYVTTIRNYVCRIDHQLSSIRFKNYTTTWAKLNKELLADYDIDEFLTPSKKVDEVLSMIEANREEGQSKIEAITEYVRKNLKWNEYFSFYPSKNRKDILAKKETNSAGINMTLTSLLRQAGYTANPVIISTRKHGVMQQVYPILNQFNHAIVRVLDGEEEIFLDATGTAYGYDVLPFRDLNNKGLMVDPAGPKWITVTAKHSSASQIIAGFELEADGTLKGTMKYIEKGYLAASSRSNFSKLDNDHEEFFKEKILGDAPEAELLSVKVENPKEINKPLRSNCEVSTTDFTNVAGDFIYIQPLLCERMEKNPFSVTKRSYPIDFGHAISESFLLNLKIPEGYKVDELPKGARAVLPDKSATFSYSIMQASDNLIQLSATLSVKKSIYRPGEYDAIRNLFDYVAKKQGEQIVLKKIQ